MEIEKLNIGYVRVSTDEQAQNGFSIDFQKERIEEKFKIEGITNYEIMVDEGISGKSLNRPKMKQILELIGQNKVQTFVVFKLDRLSRSVSDLIKFLDDCNNADVNFISIAEKIDLSTAFGRMFVYIIGIFAQFEREQISERTLAGMMEKANQGQYPYNNIPFGYHKLEDHTLVVNEKEKAIFKEVFHMYVDEFKHADYVNEYAKDKYNWNLRRNPMIVLGNTLYQGYVCVPKESDNKYYICEPLITKEEVEALEYRKHHNQVHFGYKYQYKFRNKIIINGQNARHMRKVKNGKEYNYYFVTGSPYINENDIEAFLKRNSKKDVEKRIKKREVLVSDLSHELAIGTISKKQFDIKYNLIKEKYAIKNIVYERIYIEAKWVKGKRRVSFKV